MAREEKLQLINSDLEALAYLYDYLEWLSGQPYANTTDHNFFTQLQNKIGELYSTRRSADEGEKESLTGYLHGYLLIVMMKAVKISVTCAICKSVCEKLSRKFREGILLDETIKHVATLQKHTLEILSQVNDLEDKEQRSYTGDVEFYMRKAMAYKLVHYLLHDCDNMVTLCEEAVTEKVRSESLFFKVACLSVGALCAGRLMFSVYENAGLHKMMKTALWVTCAGVTAAVLHIPRMELMQILDLIKFHHNQYVTMMSMVKPWFKNMPQFSVCNGLNEPLLVQSF